MNRLILLGASNARRGLPTAVAAARAAWGPDLQIFAAIGHGRSYGMTSSVLTRELAGIVQCGVWDALTETSPSQCRAILIDVGNDILYGASIPDLAGWVVRCLDRLRSLAADVTLAALPMANLERLSSRRFRLFRSILFPSSRMPLDAVRDSARELNDRLRRLAEERGLRMVTPRPEWYGFDPIHIRFRNMRKAWAELLGSGPAGKRLTPATSLRLRLAQPEHRALFGREVRKNQPAIVLPGGTEIRLY